MNGPCGSGGRSDCCPPLLLDVGLEVDLGTLNRLRRAPFFPLDDIILVARLAGLVPIYLDDALGNLILLVEEVWRPASLGWWSPW